VGGGRGSRIAVGQRRDKRTGAASAAELRWRLRAAARHSMSFIVHRDVHRADGRENQVAGHAVHALYRHVNRLTQRWGETAAAAAGKQRQGEDGGATNKTTRRHRPTS